MILSDKYSNPIDMWSLGCVIYEMLTGKPLFMPRSTNDLIAKMVEFKGNMSAFPDHMRSKATKMVPRTSFSRNQTMKDKLNKVLPDLKLHADHANICDLLEKMLEIDPEKRIKPIDAIAHPFFNNESRNSTITLDYEKTIERLSESPFDLNLETEESQDTKKLITFSDSDDDGQPDDEGKPDKPRTCEKRSRIHSVYLRINAKPESSPIKR